MKKLYLLFSITLSLFLFGCSSSEDSPKSGKRFEELKELPVDSVLSIAYKFYEQFQASNDSTLLDSVNDYRGHFFDRWKLATDSVCGEISPEDTLANELREIYDVVMEHEIKREYDNVVREKENWKDEKPLEKSKVDLEEFLRKWKENPDSMRLARNQVDSIREAGIMAISLDEAVAGLKDMPNRIYNHIYFVQSACLKGTPMGQRVLVLNREYETILNDFMKKNVHESREERYTIKPNKYPFWNPFISVVPRHGGEDYHFNSFPMIDRFEYNNTHDKVKLSVMQSFNSGSYYYLSKRSGKWTLVKCEDGWVI